MAIYLLFSSTGPRFFLPDTLIFSRQSAEMRFTGFFPSFILILASHVSSLRVPVTGRVPRADFDHPVSVLTTGDQSFGFSHAANLGYTATLWVNGVPFQVS